MIIALVLDTEGNEGTAYELDSRSLHPGGVLQTVEKVGEFPFVGNMLAAMIGLPVTAGPAGAPS